MGFSPPCGNRFTHLGHRASSTAAATGQELRCTPESAPRRAIRLGGRLLASHVGLAIAAAAAALLSGGALGAWDASADVPSEMVRPNVTAAGVIPSTIDSEASVARTLQEQSQIGTQLMVPALQTLEVDHQDCVSWIAVQNVGDEPTSAILIVWGEPHESECIGPLKTECTGLIKPGSSWNLRGEQLPTGSVSGMLFSIAPTLLSEVTSQFDFDDLASAYLCERTFFGVTGNCDSYVAFKIAFRWGLDFLGVPLGEVTGEPLVAHVWRACKTTAMRSVWATSTYEAIDPNAPGSAGAIAEYEYFAPRVVTGEENHDTIVHVQNGSSSDSTVTLLYQDDGGCDGPTLCDERLVRPGESTRFVASDCVGRNWSGSALIRAEQSVGVVVDIAGAGMLASYSATTAEKPRLFDDAPAGDPPAVRLYGPLSHDPDRGWTVSVSVQNMSQEVTADVTVQFLDSSGAVLDTGTGAICPVESQVFVMEERDSLNGTRAGSIRATGQAAGADTQDPPPIAAVADLSRTGYGDSPAPGEHMAYRLAPERKLVSSMTTSETVGNVGARAVAVPIFEKDLDDRNFGVTTELALSDVVPEPGWTDVAVLLFDRNDLVDVLCRRLDSGEVHYVNLQTLGAIDHGFNGSAIVSATYWEHLDSAASQPPTGRVGISAAHVTRYGWPLGEDFPGDEGSVTLGYPLQRVPGSLAAEVGNPCADQPRAAPSPTAPAPGPRDAALRGMVHLPVLRYRMSELVCEAILEVVNSGSEPAHALLVAFGEEGFCTPQCSGPLETQCSGLIAPGGSWQFGGSGELAGASSGIVFSLNDKSLDEIGADPDGRRLAADYICQQVQEEAVGNCEEYRQLRLAYNAGSELWGVPFDQVVGPPLEISVERTCGDMVDPGNSVDSTYSGLSGSYYDALQETTGGFWQSVIPMYGDHRGKYSVLYLQNTGLECTGVDLWFQFNADCLRFRKCQIPALAPGEMRPFRATECVGPDHRGQVIVHSDARLAIVAETLAEGAQTTYDAVAGKSPFDIDGNGRFDLQDLNALDDALGSSPGDVNWNPRADLNKDGAVDGQDRQLLVDNQCGMAPPSGILPPLGNYRSADQVALPVLQNEVADGTCEAAFAIQNVGDEPSESVVVFWSKPNETGGGCQGPSSVLCTGVIGPGASWHVTADAIPPGAKSAVIFSFSAELADTDLGLDPPPSWGQLLCEHLFFGAVGDCDEYSAFKQAFDTKSEYIGISLADAQGPPVAVAATRSCPSDESSGGSVRTAYAGVGANLYGRFDPSVQGFEYHMPLLYADKARFNTTMHIQNLGHDRTVVEMHYRAQDDCSSSKECSPLEIEPGETVSFSPNSDACTGPDWQGSGWLVSAQPLAVVAETSGRGTSSIYNTSPSWRDFDARGAPLRQESQYVAYSPLAYDHEDGWDIGVQVANMRRSGEARVSVTFMDEDGTPISSLTDDICPYGAQTFFLPVRAARGTKRVGSVRVESIRSVAEPERPPAPIAAVSLMIGYADAARNSAQEAVAFNLPTEAEAFDWPVGVGPGGTASGIAVLSIPLLAKTSSPAGKSGEIAIGNVVRAPGDTDIALWFFDQNGLVDVACRKLGPGQVDYIDLQDNVRLQPGYRGSALVSAYSWTHQVAAGPGGGRRSLVGLAAALVARSGSVFGDGTPNDTAGAVAAIPLEERPSVEDEPEGPCDQPPARAKPIYLPRLVVTER